MKSLARLCALGAFGMAASAQALTFEYRIIERVDNVNYIIPDNVIWIRPGTIHRYRIQFRVVPDNDADVPSGFLGWNIGTITTTGGLNYRTGAPPNPNPRGRLSPFISPDFPTSEGTPSADPFTSLTQIDCSDFPLWYVPWVCHDGEVGEPSEPPIFGRGNFVSLHEITSAAADQDYSITYGGRITAGSAWHRDVCLPPDCGDPSDPNDDIPSTCYWGAAPYTQELFSLTLMIRVCPAEWNQDRILNSQDLFDYLNDFFQNNGDFNGDGMTMPDDLYAYIGTFMDACGGG